MPPPNCRVVSNATAASDTPMSVARSTFEQDQNTITPSDGDFAFYFPPDDHQLPNSVPMKAADFNLWGEAFTHSAPLYPPPMSTSTSMFPSRQTGNSVGTAYPGSAHRMNEMIPYRDPPTAMLLPFPHQSFNSKEVPQAGTSLFIQDYSLPPNVEATSAHLMHPQPSHCSVGWQPVAGPSRSRTYPSY
jgi:hypothetical protein